MTNFRKSLGLDEPEAVQVKEKSGKATSEPSKDGMPGRARHDGKDGIAGRARHDGKDGIAGRARNDDKGGRTTVTIPAELLGKMKLLSFWMTREGMCRNMSMSQMVWEMFECYLDTFEGARGFVEKNAD